MIRLNVVPCSIMKPCAAPLITTSSAVGIFSAISSESPRGVRMSWLPTITRVGAVISHKRSARSSSIGWMGPLALSRPAHAFAGQVACDPVDRRRPGRPVGEIDVPVLVMAGNQDILTPRGDSEELAERIPTAELVVISGAAHGFMVEHGSTFNRCCSSSSAAPSTAWTATRRSGDERRRQTDEGRGRRRRDRRARRRRANSPRHDVDVRIVDKGRSVGGRLATRRIGEARLDHGAQFFTVRTPAFQAQVDDWVARGVVHVWNHGLRRRRRPPALRRLRRG